ncbi:MAG: cell division protein ZapA [Gammaproteobacteria bacterium]|jgi:cell division protein ZapA|nr:cell division protein ZapA [Gammaproteobacteria bacterium]
MSNQQDKFSIKLLDRMYTVKCTQADLAKLQKAADHLNFKLAEIRQNYKVLSREDIAMMAALNVSYELLNDTQSEVETEKNEQTINSLSKKIKEFLTQN